MKYSCRKCLKLKSKEVLAIVCYQLSMVIRVQRPKSDFQNQANTVGHQGQVESAQFGTPKTSCQWTFVYKKLY